MSVKISKIPKWTKTAIIKNFKTGAFGYNYWFEGDDKLTTSPNYFEIRYDGPYLTQDTKTEWRAFIELNCLINATRDNRQAMHFEMMIGNISDLMRRCFNVFQYDEADPTLLVGTYQLIKTGDDHLKLSNFGIIDETTKVQQGTIEGHYMMHFTFEE